jgi:Mrp family chromosome partitioning ATPase/capsular polysaccharide biosynthesis protein
VVVLAVLLLPAATLIVSLNQRSVYQASAQVLLSRQNLANSLTGTQDPSAYVQADRIAQTQAGVARVPEIARRVLKRLQISNMTPARFLEHSSVTPAQNADILTFRVRNSNPAVARALVDTYTREYTNYRRQLDTASIARARAGVAVRIQQLERQHQEKSALYANLADRDQQLATMEALQTSNAFVVTDGSKAVEVQPKPVRNAVLGLVLGLVVGIGLAFLWEALDTRVRSAEEIGERLGMSLLARLPEPSRKLRSKDVLVMASSPGSVEAEAFRILRTNLDFVRLNNEAKAIMVTSAVPQEGKSTTIANLAIALARGGERVVLVDLDLRRPSVHKFFGLTGPGVTQVAVGHVSLNDAIERIAITGGQPKKLYNGNGNGNGNGHGDGNGNGRTRVEGFLEVLPAGPIPPDPGEFVGTRALAEILGELRERADIVLVDAPPVLHVGDAMTLSTKVDGVIVVTRMNVVRRNMLAELGRQLAHTPAAKLGFVLTAAGQEDGGFGLGYGYSYGHGEANTLRADASRLEVHQ